MIALVTFFLVVVASLTATRVATVALTLTGMSPEVARFQARSALSGSGFTTSEAEAVVSHPARRGIIMFLMLIGSAGLVTAVATLSISFVGQESTTSGARVLVLVVGCIVLLALARSRLVDRVLTALFTRLLTRFTELELQDYAGLLHLTDGHAVLKIDIESGAWLCSRTLGDLQLREEGVTVLGIERAAGNYVGVPDADTVIRPGDCLVTYGSFDALVELTTRRPGADGDAMHDEAVGAQRARKEPG
ncbi:MAG: cation:proton antiporter regulatory subunit [Ilumatobacter sp.]